MERVYKPHLHNERQGDEWLEINSLHDLPVSLICPSQILREVSLDIWETRAKDQLSLKHLGTSMVEFCSDSSHIIFRLRS